ncbi:MAG TPA: hypothetical protein VKE23_01395 [Candidatus Limnocylindria bacterium]|nr:hypothetical protein [Candidatus Limnocylindria bacterium]
MTEVIDATSVRLVSSHRHAARVDIMKGSGAVLSFIRNRTGSGPLAGLRRSLPTYWMA